MAQKKTQPLAFEGDELAQHVLAVLGISLKVANAKSPGRSMDKFFFEGERAVTAYKGARAKFVKVPTFDAALADASLALLSHTKSAETAWASVRFVRLKGEGRALTRQEAERFRSLLIRTARFLYRRDKAKLAEIDRIAEGEGLADLIRDLEELAVLLLPDAELFAGARVVDVVGQCTAFATALKAKSDSASAAALHQARNRAVLALDQSLAEIRAAARFLFEDDPAALAPYLVTHPQSRSRKQK